MLLGILIFVQVFIFVFLVIILRRLLTRNITSATAHLDELSQDYVKKQEEVQNRLEEVKRMYQQRLAEAKEEAEKLKADIIKQADEEKGKIIKNARLQSEDIIRQAEKARQNLILDIEKKVKIQAIEVATSLIGKVLSEEVRRNIHSYLIREFLNGNMDSLQHAEGIKDISEVKVASSFPLTEEESSSIYRRLREEGGKNFEFVQSIDDSLIAGIVVTIGRLVLDASLKWKIREKAKELIKEE
jgi:F-type H+-transporting ATPase subunit b